MFAVGTRCSPQGLVVRGCSDDEPSTRRGRSRIQDRNCGISSYFFALCLYPFAFCVAYIRVRGDCVLICPVTHLGRGRAASIFLGPVQCREEQARLEMGLYCHRWCESVPSLRC